MARPSAYVSIQRVQHDIWYSFWEDKCNFWETDEMRPWIWVVDEGVVSKDILAAPATIALSVEITHDHVFIHVKVFQMLVAIVQKCEFISFMFLHIIRQVKGWCSMQMIWIQYIYFSNNMQISAMFITRNDYFSGEIDIVFVQRLDYCVGHNWCTILWLETSFWWL